MSLDEARRVIWPFDSREPMGDLLDRGLLSISKLRWARDKAVWADVRHAAQRLMDEIQQFEGPVRASSAPATLSTHATQTTTPAHDPAEPPRYGPQVVTASTYLKDQESWHGWMLAYDIGLSVGLLIFTGMTSISWFCTPTTWLTVVSILGAIAAWVWLLWLIRRQNMRVRSYRAGRTGEATVLDALRQSLDQRWTIDRGLQLPNRRDDLDLVLVGPGGVWAIQVKAFRNRVRVHEGRWEYQRGRRWQPVDARFTPAKVGGQAAALSDFFASHGCGRWVDTAIALTEPQPAALVASSQTPVWLPFEFVQRARALSTRIPPRAENLAQLNTVLERRAVEQRTLDWQQRARGVGQRKLQLEISPSQQSSVYGPWQAERQLFSRWSWDNLSALQQPKSIVSPYQR